MQCYMNSRIRVFYLCSFFLDVEWTPLHKSDAELSALVAIADPVADEVAVNFASESMRKVYDLWLQDVDKDDIRKDGSSWDLYENVTNVSSSLGINKTLSVQQVTVCFK